MQEVVHRTENQVYYLIVGVFEVIASFLIRYSWINFSFSALG
jgi:hypothetical protein